jgi:hypothetical protein
VNHLVSNTFWKFCTNILVVWGCSCCNSRTWCSFICTLDNSMPLLLLFFSLTLQPLCMNSKLSLPFHMAKVPKEKYRAYNGIHNVHMWQTSIIIHYIKRSSKR